MLKTIFIFDDAEADKVLNSLFESIEKKNIYLPQIRSKRNVPPYWFLIVNESNIKFMLDCLTEYIKIRGITIETDHFEYVQQLFMHYAFHFFENFLNRVTLEEFMCPENYFGAPKVLQDRIAEFELVTALALNKTPEFEGTKNLLSQMVENAAENASKPANNCIFSYTGLEHIKDFSAFLADNECLTYSDYRTLHSEVKHIGKDAVEVEIDNMQIICNSDFNNSKVPEGKVLFEKWFDKNFVVERWKDPDYSSKISALRRIPQGHHEWLMVATTPHLKRIGVTSALMRRMITPTRKTKFILPDTARLRVHGGYGSGQFHIALRSAIEKSKCLEELYENLRAFAGYYQADTLTELLNEFGACFFPAPPEESSGVYFDA
jgi:hypothetical protein